MSDEIPIVIALTAREYIRNQLQEFTNNANSTEGYVARCVTRMCDDYLGTKYTTQETYNMIAMYFERDLIKFVNDGEDVVVSNIYNVLSNGNVKSSKELKDIQNHICIFIHGKLSANKIKCIHCWFGQCRSCKYNNTVVDNQIKNLTCRVQQRLKATYIGMRIEYAHAYINELGKIAADLNVDATCKFSITRWKHKYAMDIHKEKLNDIVI